MTLKKRIVVGVIVVAFLAIAGARHGWALGVGMGVAGGVGVLLEAAIVFFVRQHRAGNG